MFTGNKKHQVFKQNWAVLSDEQMSKKLQFSLLNNEQMSNWLGVEHQPEKYWGPKWMSRKLSQFSFDMFLFLSDIPSLKLT